MSQERPPHLGLCHGARKRQATPQRPQEHWHFLVYFVSAETDSMRSTALCLGREGKHRYTLTAQAAAAAQPRLQQAGVSDKRQHCRMWGPSEASEDCTSRGASHQSLRSGKAPGCQLVPGGWSRVSGHRPGCGCGEDAATDTQSDAANTLPAPFRGLTISSPLTGMQSEGENKDVHFFKAKIKHFVS